jgi:two-component system KDP operon response regulator KdpE
LNTSSRILVVEDDPAISHALEISLTRAGYTVRLAATAAAAVQSASLQAPDVVLLDISLPDGSGLSVCRALREWSRAPILIVSASDNEEQKVAALDAGADDYVVKPYGVRELLARIRAAERRAAAPGGEEEIVTFGDVEVDLLLRRVLRGGEDVHLTPREWGLLCELCRAPEQVVSHVQLLTAVWGPAYVQETHYLRVYMGHLRRKLEADPGHPIHILTEPGVGYRLRAQP